MKETKVNILIVVIIMMEIFYHALIALSATCFTMAAHRSKNHRSTRSKWERGTQHKQE